MRRNFEDGIRAWNKGGRPVQAAKPEPRAGFWKSDGECVYPHLKQAAPPARIAAKPEVKLARGLTRDDWRGPISPLGGIARPAPKRPGLKW
jgi:hypothetical protein